MALAGILNTGRNSLVAHQAALSVVSNNTANAETEGYAKRDARLASLGPMAGVELASVRRRTELFLGARMFEQRAEAGAAGSRRPVLELVEASFAAEDGGIGARVDAFFDALRVLATDPADTQLREDVLAKAEALAGTVRTEAGRIADQRREVDRMLADKAEAVGALTAEIAELNRRITELEGSGQEASDLRDRRDVLVDDLSALVPIRTFYDETGQLTVLLGDQFTLVQLDRAAHLETEPDANLAGMRRVDLVSADGTRTDVTNVLRSGEVGGLLEVRDDALPAVLADLDRFAYDLVDQVNAIHQAGYGTDGGTGRDFFEPVALNGAAQSIRLSAGIGDNPEWIAAASTAAEAVGGNDNLLALVDLASQKVAGGGLRTFSEEIANITSVVGRMSRDAIDDETRAGLQLDQLESMRASQIGVSLDEEMIDLTRYQRAYQAGARIVTTADELYQTILNM
ncbi:MAG: flagellar hook-associated protein FlgK [Deltaproteobacteria bacterium]|nr:MAG: flagellar hook-associated protein FlgK [Deltaproteobacteria bacterium]